MRPSTAFGVLSFALLAAACGSSSAPIMSVFGGSSASGTNVSSSSTGGAPTATVSSASSTGGSLFAASSTGGSTQTLTVTPAVADAYTVPPGTTTPTVTFRAIVEGALAYATWSVDEPSIATIAPGPAGAETLIATGKEAGTVTVTVTYSGQTATRPVVISLTGQSSSSSSAGSSSSSSG